MNRKQKVVLWVAIGLFVLMGLVPPWTWTWPSSGAHARRYNEYAPIFSGHIGRVDGGRLFVQWVTLGGASAAVIFALKKP